MGRGRKEGGGGEGVGVAKMRTKMRIKARVLDGVDDIFFDELTVGMCIKSTSITV